MKSIRQLFKRLTTIEYLEATSRAFVAGKRRRSDVAWFWFRRETVLERLRSELVAQKWNPAGFDLLFIRDPKRRVIARAPIEDRIIHTAITRLLEPPYLRSASDSDYACRAGFGTHRAVLRLGEYVRRFSWFVHLDIRAYFPSVDLGILRQILARRITDHAALELIERILESGRGLYDSPRVRSFVRLDADFPPRGQGLRIGAFTSQFFAAHVYLAELDTFVKHELKIPGYLRYVDDFFLFADRRADLCLVRDRIAEWLAIHRRLRLKCPLARIRSCHGKLHGLGAAISRDGIEPHRRSLTRLCATVARESRILRPRDRHLDIAASVRSSIATLTHFVN